MITFNKNKPKYNGLYLTKSEGISDFELSYIYKCENKWFITDYPNYKVTKQLDHKLSKCLLFKDVETNE